MGCCHSDNKSSTLSQNLFGEKIREAIDSDSLKTLSLIIEMSNKEKTPDSVPIIDKEIVSINDRHLNALGYCIHLGNSKMFQFLYEKGASLQALSILFESQGLRLINFICLKGNLEILKFYLPIYLKDYNSVPDSERSYTLEFLESNMKQNKPQELAIQTACRVGHTHIVSYLYNYFKDRPYVPKEFDIYQIDEVYGEDCGLLACKTGNFTMVKMLHELCGVDFFRLNKNKENAIMVCICGCNRTPKYTYLDCINYLIQKVGVDVTYMYEEALILAENNEIIQILEEELEKKNIFVKKSEVERGIVPLKILHEVDDNSKQPIFTEDMMNFLSSGKSTSVISSITDTRSKRYDSVMSDVLGPF